jgi:hypothetical protein
MEVDEEQCGQLSWREADMCAHVTCSLCGGADCAVPAAAAVVGDVVQRICDVRHRRIAEVRIICYLSPHYKDAVSANRGKFRLQTSCRQRLPDFLPLVGLRATAGTVVRTHTTPCTRDYYDPRL